VSTLASTLPTATRYSVQAPVENIELSMRVVVFGTSLTARAKWPDDLQRSLSQCIGEPVKVQKIARGGATTEWAVGQIDRVVALAPNIVLIEMYANDAAIHNFIMPSTSRANFATILDTLKRELPTVRIVMLKMNPIFGVRSWIRPFSDLYTSGHADEVAKRHLEFLDLTDAWKSAGISDLAAAMPDGLHPNPAIASDIITPVLSTYLAGMTCPHPR
jgi:acyl-CoA thioesterase I